MTPQQSYKKALSLVQLPDTDNTNLKVLIKCIPFSEFHLRKWHEAAACLLSAKAAAEADGSKSKGPGSERAAALLNVILELLEQDAYTALKVGGVWTQVCP
jgi:hypothetical protein